jgi:hypothetical protein
VYKEFWKSLVERRGVLKKDQVMRELSDYALLLDTLPKLLCGLTGGRISKPFTSNYAVLSEVEELQNEDFSRRKRDLLKDLSKYKVIKVSELKRLLDYHF